MRRDLGSGHQAAHPVVSAALQLALEVCHVDDDKSGG